MTRVIAEKLNLDRENSKKNPEIGLEMRIISAKMVPRFRSHWRFFGGMITGEET